MFSEAKTVAVNLAKTTKFVAILFVEVVWDSLRGRV